MKVSKHFQSVASAPRSDARRRPGPAKYFPQVSHKLVWLLVRRKMAAGFVFLFEYDPCFGSQQAMDSAYYQYVKAVLEGLAWNEYVRPGGISRTLWARMKVPRDNRLRKTNRLTSPCELVIYPDRCFRPGEGKPIIRHHVSTGC